MPCIVRWLRRLWVICFSALWCCKHSLLSSSISYWKPKDLFPFTHPDRVFHQSMPSSAAGLIGSSDRRRRQRCSRCSNGTVPAWRPVLSPHLHLPDTMRIQTSERLPSHLRIPTVLKRRRPGIRRRDEGEVVFFCEETCSAYLVLPSFQDLTCRSTRLGDSHVEGSTLSQITIHIPPFYLLPRSTYELLGAHS